MQRADLVFNTKQFAENMRKWMDLYKKYKPDFYITSRYLDSLPNFSLILRDINTLVTGNFANEVQLREILNFFTDTKNFFNLPNITEDKLSLIAAKGVPAEQELDDLIKKINNTLSEIEENRKKEVERRKQNSIKLQRKLTHEEKEELKKKKEEWAKLHYAKWLEVKNNEELTIKKIIDLEWCLAGESRETKYAKIKQAMSDGLWADSLPVEFYSEAEDLGRRNTVATLILEGTLPDDEINNFYRQKFGTASPDDVALWNEDMIYFIKHQSKELIKQKSQEKINEKVKEIKKENLTVEELYLKDKLYRLIKDFDDKIRPHQIILPAFLVNELNQIQKLAAKTKNPQELENVAESNKYLYHRYRLALFDMHRNFDFYFNEMSNEKKIKLKNILTDVLVDKGILVKDGFNKLSIKKGSLAEIKTNFPFSFHYQLLRMELNYISKNRLDMYDDEPSIINAFYKSMDELAKRKDTSEVQKLAEMNSRIIAFYLESAKDFRKYPTIKALKNYINKLSIPAAESINDTYKAEYLFNNIYTNLTTLPTGRVNDKKALIKKIEEINNSNDNAELKVAKLRIALRDAIENVGSTMWGKPSLFGAGSKLYNGLMRIEQNIIQQENKLDKKPARHMKDKKK